MVILKKPIPPNENYQSNTTQLPEPIPARIPRPKYTKYSSATVAAETPDEEAEAADRLTPLRSEMRSLAAWGALPRGHYRSNHPMPNFRTLEETMEDDDNILLYIDDGTAAPTSTTTRFHPDETLHSDDDDREDVESSSVTSSDGAATYEMNERDEEFCGTLVNGEFELSVALRDALSTLNEHLTNGLDSKEKPRSNPKDDDSKSSNVHTTVREILPFYSINIAIFI